MTVREQFEQRATALKEEESTPRQLFEQRAEELEKKRLEREKRAESFKFFGAKPTAEQIEPIREALEKTIKRPIGVGAKALTRGFASAPGALERLIARPAEKLFGLEPGATAALPSRETISKVLDKVIDLKPETPVEEKIDTFSDLLGTFLFPFGGEVQAGRAAAGAGAGVGTEALLEQIGAPEGVQKVGGILASIIPFLTGRAPAGAIKPTRATQIAKREAITAPGAALVKKPPRGRLKFARETGLVRKRAADLERTVEQSKDRILETITPLAKTPSEAVSAIEEGGKLLNKAKETARKIKAPISTPNLENALNKNIKKLLDSPALATEEKGTLKFLNEIKDGLKLQFPEGIREVAGKNKLTNLTSLNTSLNKEIKFLKPTTTGDRALLDVKAALLKDIETGAKKHPQFLKEWKEGNKLFSEGKKFDRIRETLSPAFTEEGINYTKFQKIFTDPKKEKQLAKLLGQDQFDRLKDISKLSKQSADTFVEIIKTPNLAGQIERMTNRGIIFSAVMGNWKRAGAFLGEKILLGNLRGYYGRILTDPKFGKHYLNLLKAIKLRAPKAIVQTARIVNDDIEKTKKDRRN